VSRASATAKINLALVVGPKRDDGFHDVATVLQRVGVADREALHCPDQRIRLRGRRLVQRGNHLA